MGEFSCTKVTHGMGGSWTITGYTSSGRDTYSYTGNVRVVGSGSSWSYNDSQHWSKCEGCGQQTDYANHTWSSWINASAKRNRRPRKVIWSFCEELGKRTFLCSYNTEFPLDPTVYCTADCIYLFQKYLQRTDNVLRRA